MEGESAAGVAGFFVSGGTVPLDSRSYVQRSADAALFEALSTGRFCYVLNSRQMGKSSLCVRTMARLQAAGARTAFVDLTKIGGRNVTPDQWYAGLVVEVGRALGLRTEMLRNWQDESALSPMQRFFSALRDVALDTIESRVVIFIDEIDATRSLSFSANEFFAGIRECYNRRVHDPAYARLTFCLLGVAVPGDLIADPTTTPFNIGERVVLADFTEGEAAALAAGLGQGRDEVLQRILHWTHGHPFLTQSLASTAASRGDVVSAADVDRLVAELLFQAKARETNINLADVGNRILSGSSDPNQIAKYRADVLSLYEKILKGQQVFDDESNSLAAVLKLSGIVRVEDRMLKVRNRIYERVFDRHWIRENMPGAEIRRQRRAFLKGALRTGLVAAAILAVIAWLAVRATRERDRANYEVYVATMNLMGPTWAQNNLERMQDLLQSTQNSPARGWEWDYWNHMAHLEVSALPQRLVTTVAARYAPNGKVYLREDGRLLEYAPDTGHVLDLMPMPGDATAWLTPFPDNSRVIVWDGIQSGQIVDLANRRNLAILKDYNYWGADAAISPDGRWVLGARATEWSFTNNCYKSAVLFDVETGEAKSVPTSPVRGTAFSPDGKMIAAAELDESGGTSSTRAVVREFGTWKVLATFETVGPTANLFFSPGGDRLATTTLTGWVQLWDLRSRKEVSRTQVTDGTVYHLQFSSDGTWLAVSSVDRVGRLYDVQGSRLRLRQTFHGAGLLSISPNNARIAASYFTLRFYDPTSYVETPTAPGDGERADDVAVLAKTITARARFGSRGYELDPLRGESREIGWFAGAPLLAPESGESWGLIRRADGRLEIVDFDTHHSVMVLPADAKVPFSLRQFPDNRRALLVFTDKTFQIWDVKDGRLVKQMHSAQTIQTAKVSPDGRLLAAGLWGGALSFWDTTTWTERSFTRVGNWILNLGFSPDGTRLLAATGNDNAEVWEVTSGRLLGKLTGHSQIVEDAAYSPDGKRIVTASDDRTVRVWDAGTFRELTSLVGHPDQAMRARFTSDGESIVSIDIRGNAMMWLTRTPPGLLAPAAAALSANPKIIK